MSKYVDNNAILGVIGCVYQDLSLLGLEDKYNITEEDFISNFHQILFGAAYHLYNQGAKKITPKDVEDFLANKEDKLIIYQQSKGSEVIVKACNQYNVDSFDVYYLKMKKMSLLRAYEKMGIDVKDIYDPDNLFDAKKKIAQENFIDTCSLQDIIDKIDAKIDAIKNDFMGNANIIQAEAGDDIMELVESLEQAPDIGAPLYGPFINTVTRGARLNKYYIRSAPTGMGKRVADYTPIPTPDGWKTVGDIKVGDYIFGKDGKPTKVLALYKNDEKIWKMNLVDGRSIDCCGEHLWEYYVKKHGKMFRKVGNTQMIHKQAKGKCKNFYLPCNEPVDYPKQELEHDPFVVGKIFGYTHTMMTLPKKYLIGSISQRKALLKGIAQGSYSDIMGGTIVIAYKEKIKTICELCYSLGLVPKVTKFEEFYYISIEDKNYLPIKSIEPTEEVVPMTCFTVDAPDALFQVGDYVVTHNTRSMVADVCYLACDKIYDKDKGWVDTEGAKESTLYISVELDLHEVQTMMLAFVSGVNEEHILNGTYEQGERQRVLEAGTILQNADIHIEVVPDFTMKDIESIIKRNIRENKVKYIFFDYLSSSLGILKEISQATKGMKLREDNILFMLSTKLKDICNQYGVFLLTATQLSNDWMTADEPNQNLLRGE